MKKIITNSFFVFITMLSCFTGLLMISTSTANADETTVSQQPIEVPSFLTSSQDEITD